MELIGIACIIVAVVGSVHFVYKNAFSHGHGVGESIGRLQILEENVIRSEGDKNQDMHSIINQLIEEVDDGTGIYK